MHWGRADNGVAAKGPGHRWERGGISVGLPHNHRERLAEGPMNSYIGKVRPRGGVIEHGGGRVHLYF